MLYRPQHVRPYPSPSLEDHSLPPSQRYQVPNISCVVQATVDATAGCLMFIVPAALGATDRPLPQGPRQMLAVAQ